MSEAAYGRCSCCGVTDIVVRGDSDGALCTTCWCRMMDEREGATYRYFVKLGTDPEQEVSKAEWVATERRAGFVNTTGHPEEPGTGGFSTTVGGGIEGRIERLQPGAEGARSDG